MTTPPQKSHHAPSESTIGGDDQPPIFVYGTLRHGGENYGLLKGRTVAEIPATLRGVRMYSLRWYPILLDATPDEVVQGELMIIHPQLYWQVLAALDRLEDYYEGCDEKCLYQRQQRCVVTHAGREVMAWTYVGTPALVKALNPEPIASGNWMDYWRERLRTLRGE
jgi:gamma-glutamylcyclotransferase (GGCT)/AIG2-like uncharacterized protein YtfP